MRYEDQAARLRPDLAPADRLRIGMVLLWEVVQDEGMRAIYDIYAAARTDEALRSHLCAVVQDHTVHFHALAQVIFGDVVAVGPTRFHAVLEVVSATMRGMITDPPGMTSPADEQRMLCMLADLTIKAVSADDAGGAPAGPLSVVSTRP